ncbi:DNA-directed RNA polymerase [Lithospermum erythrorhizon]|uniref:DNA-directed RNA polymerase n=1 Tax=Lithospermum erythrorhizon TaxID=34254 RepID=A0AAV3QH13_LITER
MRFPSFSPADDKNLSVSLSEGVVVKVSQQSIHLIVLGFSSAVIMEEDMRDEFKYKFKDVKEVFISKQHKKHRIENGDILRFAVKSFDEEMLHISGSLEPAHTWLEKNSEKWAQTESNRGWAS